jgi:hypothetical protein
MEMACQQNRSFRRILVSNGTMLPNESRFNVLSYRPTQQDSDWSHGPYLVAMTR